MHIAGFTYDIFNMVLSGIIRYYMVHLQYICNTEM